MAWNIKRDRLLHIYIDVHSQCHCELTLNGTIDAGLAPDVWPPLWHAVHRSDSLGQVCVEVAYCCKLGLGMLESARYQHCCRHGGRRDSQQRRPRQCGSTRRHIHVGKSPSFCKLGLGIREIMVGAGTSTDVIAGWAGAAGPAPDVWHQFQGIRGVRKKISQS